MTKVVVAMSGGVDSSVAALLSEHAGHQTVGISMQVWDYRKNGGCDSKATCCSPDDFTDARKVAAMVGIPYYVFDFEHAFRQNVIEPFIATYEAGATPNPCVDCNNKVKFRELRERALTFGCDIVATGHYAQIVDSPEGKRLYRGVDRDKDQSYFLYGLLPQELENTWFPVGAMTKQEVRDIASEYNLPTASKPESQDICFVQGGLKRFLERHTSIESSGQIRHIDGTLLGSHEGVQYFTVGQRKGIGVSGRIDPVYVIEIDPSSRTVFVGPKSALETEGLIVQRMNWVSPQITASVRKGVDFEIAAVAQLRHRHDGVPVTVHISPTKDQVKAVFTAEWSTVSPGQAAVFYDQENREVLGGGVIRSNISMHRNRGEDDSFARLA